MTSLLLLIAGTGSRLMPYTQDRPKCLVPLAGKPILERQLMVFKDFDLRRIIGVCGYKKESLSRFKQIHLVENEGYATTNISRSLLIGLETMLGEGIHNEDDFVIICYGDIVFHPDVFRKLYHFPGEFVTVADLDYLKLWSTRMPDPLSDLETLKISEDGSILEIGGKPKSYSEIDAQYIGLTKISVGIARKLKEMLKENVDQVTSLSMTHFMDYLVQKKGMKLVVCPVKSGWVEIDSIADLKAIEPRLDNFLVAQE